MKKTKDNIEHRIQLKKIEIENYKKAIVNYPPDRMEKYAKPFIQRLNDELEDIQKEMMDDRASRNVTREND